MSTRKPTERRTAEGLAKFKERVFFLITTAKNKKLHDFILGKRFDPEVDHDFLRCAIEEERNLETLEDLLDHFEQPAEGELSALDHAIRYAIENSNLDLVKSLVKGDLERIDAEEYTLLMYAIFCGASDEILGILSNQDMNAPNQYGLTPLMWALTENPEVINALCRLGADVNQIDPFGNTALIKAVLFWKTDAVRDLLENGANINQANKTGDTPLIVAIREGVDLEILDLLLAEPTVDIFQANSSGLTPLQVAVVYGNPELIERLSTLGDPQFLNRIQQYRAQNKLEAARKLIESRFSGFLSALPLEDKWRASSEYAFIQEVLNERAARYTKIMSAIREAVGSEGLAKNPIELTKDTRLKLDSIFEEKNLEPNESLSFEHFCASDDEILRAYQCYKFDTISYEVRDAMKKNDFDKLRGRIESWGYDEIIFLKEFLPKYSKDRRSDLLEMIYGGYWASDFYNQLANDLELEENLVLNGMSFSDKDLGNDSVFHIAIREKDFAMIQRLFQNHPKSSTLLKRSYDICPLRYAIECEADDILKFLLDQGADPNYGCDFKHDKTLLKLAKTDAQKTILIGAGAKIDQPTLKSDTIDTSTKTDQPKLESDTTGAGTKIDQAKSESKKRTLNIAFQKEARRLGHILGVEKTQFANLSLDTQGADLKTPTHWMNELLNSYESRGALSDPAEQAQFDTIQAAYLDAQHFVNKQASGDELIQRYRNRELLCFPIRAYGRHTFFITIFDGMLAISNRGEGGDKHYGTKIYPIKAGVDMEKFLAQILFDLSFVAERGIAPAQTQQKYLMETIGTVVDLDTPFDQLDQKRQKHGTCAVANPKAGIQAALYLLILQEKLRALGDTPVSEGITQACRELAKARYKKFTNFFRNFEIDMLLEKVQAGDTQVENPELYYEFLTAVILEHQEFDKKNGQQGLRICKIWEALPKEYQDRIVQEIEGFEEMKDSFIERYQHEMPVLHQFKRKSSQAPPTPPAVPKAPTP